MDKNIFGEPLKSCCSTPLTGYFRDGYCRTDKLDYGNHSVCVIVTEDFLEFSKQNGNDLITPQPKILFPGLKAGDKWCLCAIRWQEAFEARDWVVEQLHSMKQLIKDPATNKEDLLHRVEDLLCVLDPKQDGSEND